jgi:hypothetical protein
MSWQIWLAFPGVAIAHSVSLTRRSFVAAVTVNKAGETPTDRYDCDSQYVGRKHSRVRALRRRVGIIAQ